MIILQPRLDYCRMVKSFHLVSIADSGQQLFPLLNEMLWAFIFQTKTITTPSLMRGHPTIAGEPLATKFTEHLEQLYMVSQVVISLLDTNGTAMTAKFTCPKAEKKQQIYLLHDVKV